MSVVDGAIIKDIKVYTPATIDKKKSLKVTNSKKGEQFIGINCIDGYEIIIYIYIINIFYFINVLYILIIFFQIKLEI